MLLFSAFELFLLMWWVSDPSILMFFTCSELTKICGLNDLVQVSCRFTCLFHFNQASCWCANNKLQGHTTCNLHKRSRIIWKWTVLQSHSKAFVGATKFLMHPAATLLEGNAIKSYSLKMSFSKLFCWLSLLVWFGNMMQHFKCSTAPAP